VFIEGARVRASAETEFVSRPMRRISTSRLRLIRVDGIDDDA
jgi:hypothetical protein